MLRSFNSHEKSSLVKQTIWHEIFFQEVTECCLTLLPVTSSPRSLTSEKLASFVVKLIKFIVLGFEVWNWRVLPYWKIPL
jgi:hypothetical protein